MTRPAAIIIPTSILLVFMALGACSKALAQSVPASQDVAAESQRLQKRFQELQGRFEPKKMDQNKLPQEQSLKKSQTVFVLKGIEVEGVSFFTDDEIAQLYRPYINKHVNLNDINSLVVDIKDKYKSKGYLTTTVYIPEQEVKDGIVRISVIEGKMGRLTIEGNRYFSSRFLWKNIHLPQGQILDMNQLNRDLLRLNKIPDLKAKSVVVSGQQPGTTDIVLKVQERRTWHLGNSFDNNGSRVLGKFRGGTYIRSTNATGLADSLFVNTLNNSNLLANSISYRLPLGTKGTQLAIDYSRFTMKLGKQFKSFDITGSTNQGSIGITQELYLTESTDISLTGGIDIKSITKHVLSQRVTDDQLRIPHLGMSLSHSDAWGTTSFSPQIDFGTGDFLGASNRNHPTASRAGTGGFYVKYHQELNRIQKMPLESFLRLESEFSAASRTLASSEQFQIGGEGSVRGYPQGDYSADLGGTASMEWNFPMYLIPKEYKLPNDQTPFRNRLMPYVFVDAGVGKLKKVLPGERLQKSLVGLGAGFRLRLYDTIFFNADWAAAVGDDPSTGNGPSTFHFSLQSEI